MSWTNVKPFFTSVLEAQGFSNWPDGFNIENIPANILDHAFHIFIPSIQGVKNSQWDQETSIPVEVVIFLKGYNDPSSAIDEAILSAQNIVSEVMRPSVRTQQTCIQNVIFSSVEFNPLAESNDNAVLALLNFEARVILETLT
jgi:hypothetical protein